MINCSKFVCSKNKEVSTAQQCRPFVTFFVNCSNPVEPGLTGFEQLINFVLSSWFAAKSVEQMIVEQSNFEQFTPTHWHKLLYAPCFSGILQTYNVESLNCQLLNKLFGYKMEIFEASCRCWTHFVCRAFCFSNILTFRHLIFKMCNFAHLT